MTDQQYEAIVAQMPDGMEGFLKSWGLRQFAEKALAAAPSAVANQASDGWLQSGGMLYRLTDERRPKNRDEIRVTMADSSRSDEACTRRAGELLDRILSAGPALEAPAAPAYRAEMGIAGRDYLKRKLGYDPDLPFAWADLYAAMLAAAPALEAPAAQEALDDEAFANVARKTLLGRG